MRQPEAIRRLLGQILKKSADMLGRFGARANLARNREVQVDLTKKRLYGNAEALLVRGAYVSNSAGRPAIIMVRAAPCDVEEFASRHSRSS
jgi:hypothetical protein